MLALRLLRLLQELLRAADASRRMARTLRARRFSETRSPVRHRETNLRTSSGIVRRRNALSDPRAVNKLWRTIRQ